MEAAIEELESADVSTEEATTEVPVSEETQAEPQVQPEPRQSRADRKRQRIDVEAANRERDELRRTLETERQERQRIAQEVAEMRGRLAERDTRSQQQDRHAETKAKIKDLEKQARAHLFFSSQAKDQATAEAEWDKYKELERQAADLHNDMRDEERWEKRRGEIGSQIPNQEVLAERSYITARFPWVESNIEGRSLADARYSSLVNSGRPQSRETLVEAMTWAAQKLGLGGTNGAPTNSQRQLYAGIPSGEGAGGDDRPRSIKMGRHEEAMARAAYPHLDAKQAYKQWAKDMVEKDNDDE